MPHFVGADLWKFLQSPENWLVYLSVIVPMGIFNVVGSLQNIESADAAGDKYAPLPSLAANGIGTLAAAFLGSCFPTTIYIGHPGWKAMGARSGYSILNGLAIGAICLTGTVTLISRIIPLEAGVPIVLWIGVIIIAQAFMATPPEHSPAVAVGFFPAIAAWGATIVIGAFQQAQGRTLQQLFALPSVPSVQGKLAEVNGFLIHGMFVLERGFIFSCMILSALCVMLIDRRFAAAAIWSLVAAIFSFLGVMHAYQLSGNHVDFLFIGVPPRAGADCFPAWGIGACYVMFALIFWAAEWWVAKRDETLSGREREHR